MCKIIGSITKSSMYCSKMCKHTSNTFESPVLSKVVGQVILKCCCCFRFRFFLFRYTDAKWYNINRSCLLPLYCCLLVLFIAFSFVFVFVHYLAFVYGFNFSCINHSSESRTWPFFLFLHICIFPNFSRTKLHHLFRLFVLSSTFQYHVPTKENETSKCTKTNVKSSLISKKRPNSLL